jgi:hypothetical protein
MGSFYYWMFVSPVAPRRDDRGNLTAVDLCCMPRRSGGVVCCASAFSAV